MANDLDPEPTIELTRWIGPWPDDDPDANFKADVALYANADPLRTLRGMSRTTGIPVGALVRYVLARWASEGSSGLLEIGPTMTRRLAAVSAGAEAVGTDDARLAAYHQLRQMLSWLNHPLDHPEVYEESIDRVHRARSLNAGDDARRYYDRWAVNYDHDVFDSLGFTGPRRVAEALAGRVPPTAGVLDAGCGTGAVGVHLAELGFGRIDGIDLSPGMLRAASHKHVYRNLIEADLNQPIALDTASYDAVVSAGTFVAGHLGAGALEELVRVLRPGGTLVATVLESFWETGGFGAVVERMVAAGRIAEVHIEDVPVTTDTTSVVRLLSFTTR